VADIETLLKTALAGVAGGRLYPNKIEQGQPLPAIVYQSSRTPINTLGGRTNTTQVAVTLTAVAESFQDARSTAQSIKTTMDADTTIKNKFLSEEPGDQFDPETGLHLYGLVYTLWQTD